MYFIEKMGVYSHGIFWIGEDLEEGKRLCDEFANLDVDDHHEWKVMEFGLIKGEKPKYGKDNWHWCQNDANHKIVYTAAREQDTGRTRPWD